MMLLSLRLQNKLVSRAKVRIICNSTKDALWKSEEKSGAFVAVGYQDVTRFLGRAFQKNFFSTMEREGVTYGK